MAMYLLTTLCRRVRSPFLVITTAFGVAGTALLVAGMGDLVDQWRTRRFVGITGSLLSEGTQVFAGGRRSVRHWEPVVAYSYLVDGVEYTGSVYAKHRAWVEPNWHASRLSGPGYSASAVAVYYSRSQPTDAVLVPSQMLHMLDTLGPCLSMWGLGLVCCGMYYCSKRSGTED